GKKATVKQKDLSTFALLFCQPGSCQCPFPMSVSQITQSLYLSGVDAVFKPNSHSRRNITLSAPQQSTPCLQVPIVDQPHAILLACHFTVVAECIHQNQSGSTLGVSLRQAHEWVLKYRPHIRPNAVFWRQQREMAATSCGVLPEALDRQEAGLYCVSGLWCPPQMAPYSLYSALLQPGPKGNRLPFGTERWLVGWLSSNV
uniref:Uncharacterized protein n=1 Tax=Hucho hucho TaxID=62062 RepID=A0A4W5PV21_9TELE